MSVRDTADLELLSAYLDDELTPQARAELERRLAAEPALRAELEALQGVVRSVRAMPVLQAPRDFRLDPAIYGRKPQPVGRAAPRRAYRWASALSAAAAAVTLALGVLGILGPRFTANVGAPAVSEIAFAPTDSAPARTNSPAVALPEPLPAETLGRGGADITPAPAEDAAALSAPQAAEAEDTTDDQTFAQQMTAAPRGMGGGADIKPTLLPDAALSAQDSAEGAPITGLAAPPPAAQESQPADAQQPDARSMLPQATPPVTAIPSADQPPTAIAEALEMEQPAAEQTKVEADGVDAGSDATAAEPADETLVQVEEAASRTSFELDPGMLLGGSLALLALSAVFWSLSRRR